MQAFLSEDYERLDLTRQEWMRQKLSRMSIENGERDWRDDLVAIAFCYFNLAVMEMDADRVVQTENGTICRERWVLEVSCGRTPAERGANGWEKRRNPVHCRFRSWRICKGPIAAWLAHGGWRI
jgi:hypothetical protein